ncbi:glycosyltransferase [Luteolibacter yonseiensis]|uniref:Glycosyltransferase n=1 Tax=Luteolibacter yonseiensis TaxID=1144680 RepID=A0A934VA21_9BACT|nr:glycosyltransferase [Luteolibacter yonseiensis]MBK1814401.1 glycosyltransferase [Luteolibacter yonseiensis]
MTSRTHIALIAVACSPSQGSELGLAWKAVVALSEQHRLTVFVHCNHEHEILDHLESGNVEKSIADARFVFVGRTHQHNRNQAIARLMNWHYYRIWLDECVDAVIREHRSDAFDLVHHVTYSTWRMGSPFYKTGIPSVWGPVGGAGNVPFSAYGMLSTEAKITEGLRTMISKLYSLSPSFRRSLERNTVVLASNQETRHFLNKFTSRPVQVVFPTYFEPSEQGGPDSLLSESGPLNCFYGGGIIGSKGIALSFAAIARARDRGVDVVFRIAGPGPEVAHLQKNVARLGIEDRVTFLPLLKGADYRDILNKSDIFLFPSFRENIGMTMVDSMLHQVAPVVLDTSAPGEIVTPECGWKIPVAANPVIVEKIADAIIQADSDRRMLRKKAEAAKNRILDSYSKPQYLRHVRVAYEKALAPSRQNA